MSEPVVITGMGAVSALGFGLDAQWQALAAGRDGMRPIERFDVSAFTAKLGGLVPREVPPGATTPPPTFAQLGVDDAKGTQAIVEFFAVEAGREALARSGVDLAQVDRRRVALVLGTSMGSWLGGLHESSARVAKALGLEGPVLTISTACASSTNAVGTGRDLLDEGLADVVLAGGSDALGPEIFAGFAGLGLLNVQKCAPFSESIGTTLGEGAGFVVLERESRARARGAKVTATLAGYALSADGYHATSPEPSGAGVARALKGALEDAAIPAGEVGYVNAHGTGTAANDPAEWTAITTALGERAAQVPVSSTKSYLAHAQGAAGILELIATLLAMEHGAVLPTLHVERVRRRAPVDPVAESAPRAHAWDVALSNNSAFGGANAVLAVSKQVRARRPEVRRPVFIAGVGAVGPFGTSLEALDAWNGEGRRLAEFELEALAPQVDPRGLDPSARALTAAVALALRSSGLTISGAARERTGLFVGTTNASPSAWDEFRRSQRERGLARVSAPAFTRLVLNAAAGTVTRAFGLRGPTTTLTTGRGSGLAALAVGAWHLATRLDVDTMVVAAVDEVDAEKKSGCDAAVAVVLTTSPGKARLAKWALQSPLPRGGEGQGKPARLLDADASAGLLEVARSVVSGARAEVSDSSEACSVRVVVEPG
ncbi:MAG: beta-ketoacyl-[acyl-carrier-protein] synthase family protein [Myxococcaceae bacterium]